MNNERSTKVVKGKSLTYRFESVAAMTEFCDPNLMRGNSAGFIGEAGLDNFTAVEKRTKAEWQIGLEVLAEYTKKLSECKLPEVKSTERKKTFSFDEGDEVDYDRLFAGDSFFSKSERENSTGPTQCTIIIDTTTPASMDSLDILWRGAAAIALAKRLEEKGYQVEMWVVNGSKLFKGKNTNVITACRLKLSSDPLDVSTLVNTVAGWYYRTATFTALETICKVNNEKPAMGLGACYTPTQDDLDAISPDQLRIYSAGVYTFNGAFDVVTRELAKLANGGDNN